MNVSDLINGLVKETTQTSLGLFSPELALCVAIVGLLLNRLVGADRWLPSYWMALIGGLAAFVLSYIQFIHLREPGSGGPQYFFTGMLVYDQFTVFFRLFLLLFLILVIALTVLTGIPDNEDGPDFYTLLLGSTVGMMLMASANNLLILFLSVEMASVPSYAMVGFLKGRKLSSEAALKYVVYGAGAAGVMLYGISLIAGLLGTTDLSQIAEQVNMLLYKTPGGQDGTAGVSHAAVRTLVLAVMMVLVGLAFKLSLVPFHFWCPDAFEGASAEVAGFLSVASKAAAFALTVRFVLAFVGDGTGAMNSVNLSLGIGLGVIAAVTMTFGNLAAYAQTNIKRLLAYSTIAHAGYMLAAVAALVVMMSADPASQFGQEFDSSQAQFQVQRCIEALLFYLAVYLFMNLGAFAIVAIIRNQILSEDVSDYAGIGTQAPVLGVCMLICLFSLIGLPPLGGFVGKWMVFASMLQAGKAHWFMWALLAIAGANTVFSLFYYLRVVKTMFLDARPDGAPKVEANANTGLYVAMISLPVLLFGFFGRFIEGLSQTAHNVASVVVPVLTKF